jgi:hypothetical protein
MLFVFLGRRYIGTMMKRGGADTELPLPLILELPGSSM